MQYLVSAIPLGFSALYPLGDPQDVGLQGIRGALPWPQPLGRCPGLALKAPASPIHGACPGDTIPP